MDRQLILCALASALFWFSYAKGESESFNQTQFVSDQAVEEKSVNLYVCGSSKLKNNKESKSESKEKVDLISWIAPKYFMSTGIETTFSLQYNKEFECKAEFHVSLSKNMTETKNRLFSNGYFRIEKEFYAPDEYCLESITDNTLEVKACPPECGKTRACIPKCCEIDKVYSVGVKGTKGCQPGKKFFDPPFYEDLYTKVSPKRKQEMPLPHYFLWKTKDFKYNCHMNFTTLVPLSEIVAKNLSLYLNRTFHSGHFRIRNDGAVLYKDGVEQKCSVELEPKKVLCFDGIQDYSQDENDGFMNREDEYTLILCTAWNVEDLGTDANQLIYGILMLIVSIFPLMTCIIYTTLWKRMNAHGWTIAATTGSLFMMYIFNGIAVLIGGLKNRENIENTWGCIFVAIFAHFFFLAAFAWMTCVCVDLWWTFRSLTPTNRRSKGRKRFLKFSLFGWGFPTAFVMTGIILDFSHSPDDCTPHILPGYGTHSCYILPNSQGVYNYYPVAVLLSFNLLLFCATCYKLLQYRKNTRIATKRETDHCQGFARFAKLFLVMGVSWIFEILSWSIDGFTLKWYWVILDLFNILRAIGVFIVYVCKQDILAMLEDTHPSLKKMLQPCSNRNKNGNDYMEASGSTALVSPSTLEPSSSFRMQSLSK